uniref:Uncharacterized protein n=1 Tax=Candidozyma auris TaxID=498019 RepID=A0A0L0NTI6_CANAR
MSPVLLISTRGLSKVSQIDDFETYPSIRRSSVSQLPGLDFESERKKKKKKKKLSYQYSHSLTPGPSFLGKVTLCGHTDPHRGTSTFVAAWRQFCKWLQMVEYCIGPSPATTRAPRAAKLPR